MTLLHIVFTAKQDHLIVAPRLVSKTHQMSIWAVTLHPDEIILCSKSNSSFLWIARENSPVELILETEEKQLHTISKGSYPTQQTGDESIRVLQFKNRTNEIQKFTTIEYND